VPDAPDVLVVDDDEVFRSRLARALGDRGWKVRQASDVATARTAIEEAAPGHAVIDLRLPDGSGLEVVRAARSASRTAPIIVLTGYGSIATALEAVRLGATNYLTKPTGVDEILAGFSPGALTVGEPPAPADTVPSLARVEWEHINRVLVDSGGNVSEAARRLGMHRRTLQRKLSKHPTRR
jgi:two-component system, response regulator RegA